MADGLTRTHRYRVQSEPSYINDGKTISCANQDDRRDETTGNCGIAANLDSCTALTSGLYDWLMQRSVSRRIVR